jgi:hypothetical protein
MDERLKRIADEWDADEIGDFWPVCGAPEPCSTRAFLDALSAQADYWEGMS